MCCSMDSVKARRKNKNRNKAVRKIRGLTSCLEQIQNVHNKTSQLENKTSYKVAEVLLRYMCNNCAALKDFSLLLRFYRKLSGLMCSNLNKVNGNKASDTDRR